MDNTSHTDIAALRERLRKLLALAERGLPGEAAVALEKARRLSAEIGESFESAAMEERVIFTCGRNVRKEHYCTHAILGEFFDVGCAFVQQEKPHTFDQWEWVLSVTGTPAAVTFAEYVAGFLVRHWQFLWEYRRGRVPKDQRDEFIEGLYSGLWDTLEDERRAAEPVQETALTETDLDELELECEKPERLSAAKLRGMALGGETRIRKPLGGAASHRPALPEGDPQ